MVGCWYVGYCINEQISHTFFLNLPINASGIKPKTFDYDFDMDFFFFNPTVFFGATLPSS